MKNIKSKILSIAALTATPIATVASLASCGDSPIKEYHIVNLNDLHGAVPGYGEDVTVVSNKNPGLFRWYKEAKSIINQYPGSIILSAGDENSGDSWSTSHHGLTTYPILREMGVRYCAVGNHAFEWGYDYVEEPTTKRRSVYDFLGRTPETQGNYFVTANIFDAIGYNDKKDWVTDLEGNPTEFIRDFDIWNDKRVKWADPYKIVNFGDAKVCLIGLTTTGTTVDGNASVTKALSFVDYQASVYYSKYLAYQELGEAEYNKIDSFILLTHCAGDIDSTTKEITGEAAELGKTITTDVDGIISAHSHKVYAGKVHNDKLAKDIPIVQAGTAAQHLADTKLVFDHSKPAGKKLQQISMSVRPISVPKDLAQAKAEWTNYYTNPTAAFKTMAEEYALLRSIIKEDFDTYLSKADLQKTADDMQNSEVFEGYYNGIKYALDPEGKPVQPGHSYYDNASEGCAVLDHFGGWVCRTLLLGLYYQYYDKIHEAKTMPSCAFLTQDSIPTNLKNGNINVREIYDMIPYDNKLSIFYMNIFQLANIINYSLSGKAAMGPDPVDPSKTIEYGFKYHDFNDNRKYQPDLRFYVDINDEQSYRVEPMRIALETPTIGEDDLKIKSSYTCGPLSFHGIQVELVKIKDPAERSATLSIDKTSYGGNPKAPLYDLTATYRVATESTPTNVVVGGRTCSVHLPKIKVFKYEQKDDGTDNLQDFDNPSSLSWKDQHYWATDGKIGSTNDTGHLIPCLTNSFMYSGGADQTGGNNQCNAFREYSQWNIEKYSITEDLETKYFAREIMRTFLENGLATDREWKTVDKKSIAPVNIAWSKIKDLVKILSE